MRHRAFTTQRTWQNLKSLAMPRWRLRILPLLQKREPHQILADKSHPTHQPTVMGPTSLIATGIGRTGAAREAGEMVVEDEEGEEAAVVPGIAIAMAQGQSASSHPSPLLSFPPMASSHHCGLPMEDNWATDPNLRGERPKNIRRADKEVKPQRRFDPALTTGDDGAPKQTNMSIPFSAEEIAAEDRRPKRKVAVLIGYAGTGYKGMQMNHHEKTIEGDLFAAFVAAGAIAKRNADDPKKSSFIRCARTDKGVHAAGNVISLKLTIEDPDIVTKINEKLPDQIRIWGIQRTNNAFNCYQACDSRWYEYLLPSYSLLPPHPQSYLGKKIISAADEKGVSEERFKPWDDVKDFWDEVEKNDIQPILARLDDKTREEVIRSMHSDDARLEDEDNEPSSTKRKADEEAGPDVPSKKAKTEQDSLEGTAEQLEGQNTTVASGEGQVEEGQAEEAKQEGSFAVEADQMDVDEKPTDAPTDNTDGTPVVKPKYQPTPAQLALRAIKTALVAAKRRYRVTPARIQQLQAALDQYRGTNNFHNYTIKKPFKDPSAKRHIRSFEVNPNPIQIGDTEWLSLKVHGQSFMMHQIRKMVAMAVLCVRCAVPVSIIKDSYGPTRISIPKAPGLGLLLERPVFESYSKKAEGSFDKEPLNFTKFEKEIDEFKQKQIYNRIYDTEEKENS